MAFTRLNLNDINGLKGQKQIARGIALGNMAVIPNEGVPKGTLFFL